jgi:hypothetical protein
VKGKTAFQQIQMYYEHGKDRVKLTKKAEEVHERLQEAFTVLKTCESKEGVANFLIEKFEISLTQAYRDVRMAERLFGNVKATSKEFMRALLTEIYRERMKDAIEKNNDELIIAYGKELRELQMLDVQDDAGLIPEELLQPKPIHFTADPAELRMQQEELDRKAQKIEEEYIAFQDVEPIDDSTDEPGD